MNNFFGGPAKRKLKNPADIKSGRQKMEFLWEKSETRRLLGEYIHPVAGIAESYLMPEDVGIVNVLTCGHVEFINEVFGDPSGVAEIFADMAGRGVGMQILYAFIVAGARNFEEVALAAAINGNREICSRLAALRFPLMKKMDGSNNFDLRAIIGFCFSDTRFIDVLKILPDD